MIWVVFAILTAAAALSVLIPLARAGSAAGAASGRQRADVAFFEAESASIARDLERGVIDAAEAEAAHAEAARRLIAAAGDDEPGRTAGPWSRRIVALASLAFIAVGGVGLYGFIGAPDYPDQPLVARRTAPPDQMDMMAALSKIEAHLAQNPGDGRGREIVAPVYMRIGRYGDAARAWSEAISIMGANAERETSLGEALTFAAEGKVTGEALAAFQRAHALSPDYPQARFYLGMAAEQAGDKARAAELWSALYRNAAPDSPWRPMLAKRLEGIGYPVQDGASGAPQGEAAAAIAALPADQREVAIRGMVESLAARLEQNGADPDGWRRLVRAYVVLKEPEKAKAALAKARRALSADADALAGLDAFAREMGLGG